MNIIPTKIQIKICQNSITSLYVVILKIVEFEKGGNDRLWFISSDRYSNEEILRAWPRARHGMEWQLKLDSSYFKRYFSQPLWLRFFSSSSYSLIFSSPVFPGFSVLCLGESQYFWSSSLMRKRKRERFHDRLFMTRFIRALLLLLLLLEREERWVNVGRWEFYGDRIFTKIVLCAGGANRWH